MSVKGLHVLSCAAEKSILVCFSESKEISSSPSVAAHRFTHTEDSLPLVSLRWLRLSATSFHFNQLSLFQMFSSVCPHSSSLINNQSQLMLHLQKALICMFLSGWRVSINAIHCVCGAALGQQLHWTQGQSRDHSNKLRLYGYMYESPSFIPPLFLGRQLTTQTHSKQSPLSAEHVNTHFWSTFPCCVVFISWSTQPRAQEGAQWFNGRK